MSFNQMRYYTMDKEYSVIFDTSRTFLKNLLRVRARSNNDYIGLLD